MVVKQFNAGGMTVRIHDYYCKPGRPRFRCVNHRNCHTASCDYAKTEEQVISALRQWVKGYTVEIENVGFESEADSCRDRIGQLTAELEKLNAQLDNAFDLVEQGLYTKE